MTDKKFKEMTGTVLRRSGDKTVAVAVARVVKHPRYQKRQIRNKTYLAHDPKNSAEVGSRVTIRETRPLSARKHWIIVK
jgi:small subunit ribosomal protein S17